MVLDYRPATRDAPTLTGTKDCIHIDMPGRTQGRVWVDRDTHAVLRLDESIVGVTDVRVPRELQKGGWGLLRDRRARRQHDPLPARHVREPDETLLLPTRVESVTVIRSDGHPTPPGHADYRNYRRFLTETRVLP